MALSCISLHVLLIIIIQVLITSLSITDFWHKWKEITLKSHDIGVGFSESLAIPCILLNTFTSPGVSRYCESFNFLNKNNDNNHHYSINCFDNRYPCCEPDTFRRTINRIFKRRFHNTSKVLNIANTKCASGAHFSPGLFILSMAEEAS